MTQKCSLIFFFSWFCMYLPFEMSLDIKKLKECLLDKKIYVNEIRMKRVHSVRNEEKNEFFQYRRKGAVDFFAAEEVLTDI